MWSETEEISKSAAFPHISTRRLKVRSMFRLCKFLLDVACEFSHNIVMAYSHKAPKQDAKNA